MITELVHHWALLRLLFIFVLAAPLLLLAALPRRQNQPRGRKTQDAVSVDTPRSAAGHSPVTDSDQAGQMRAGSVRPGPPADIGEGRLHAESERRVEPSPHEWRWSGVAPNRRAA